MKQDKLKVAVGLSGGVDSAVSAYLLKNEGYDVTGVHVVCWDEGPQCKAREDRADALKVALKLGIPFEVLDFQKEYKERVIDRFYTDYKKGLTPNPDVWCNSEIKFGLFLEWAMENGFVAVATGHYAKKQSIGQISQTGQIVPQGHKLLIPKDTHKDQTYFLHRLTQKELAHVIFPLGDLLKSEVREIAKKAGLPVATKKDSQGICFIGDIDVHEFLKRRLKEQLGEVVDTKGKVIGTHSGVWFYTIGQRGGWTVTPEYQKKFGGEAPIFYVVEKEVKKNRLVVGFGAETYKESFQVRDISWIRPHPDPLLIKEREILVRIRHGGKLLQVIGKRLKVKGGNLEIILEEPQRGVAPGQAAVFYRNGECLGGGIIA